MRKATGTSANIIKQLNNYIEKDHRQVMSLYFREDSSFTTPSVLDLTSKFEPNQEEDTEEVALLYEKISEMEKNYIAMEKHYAQKIKSLYAQISQKDTEFKKLRNQMEDIKTVAINHKKKVEELSQTANRKPITSPPPVKSKSPVMLTKKTINNVETETSPKSQSPKNEPKRNSPAPKTQASKKIVVPPKNPIENNTFNTSSEKLNRKNMSPKHSNQLSKKILPKVDEMESMRLVKKTGPAFREKPPTLK